MLEIAVHEDADEELKAAASFYESREMGLGQLFLQRIADGFALIQDQPFAGSPLSADIRRLLVRQFPYSLVYRVEKDSIFILAVAHWHRRPGYWRTRA